MPRTKAEYQGDYSEFDDDLGWNDFALRSYDPQLGRFLQSDPYDQFASGYVGMGNDPGNGVDPSGGLFGGPGVGCAATAGMAGYGGMTGRMASIGSISQTLSTVLSISSTAMKSASLLSNISATSSTSSPASSSSSVYKSGGGASSTGSFGDDGGGGENGCNCPPGYGPKPKPGGDQRPYFLSANNAARYWAFKHRAFAMSTSREYSSEIFSFQVGVGNSKATLFGSTNSVHFPDLSKAYNFSPGIGDPLHGEKPKGATVIGHIHYHWLGSNEKSKGTRSDNRTFSEPDKSIHKYHPEKFLYVLGATGMLYVKYPERMPLENGWPNPDEGQIKPLEGGFFDKNKKQPDGLCPCYKQ